MLDNLNINLKQIKVQYHDIMSLTEKDLQVEIDKLMLGAIHCELMSLVEDGMEIDEIASVDTTTLVVGSDIIFDKLIEDKIADLNYQLADVINEASSYVIGSINVTVRNFKLIYSYRDFTSYDYNKAVKYYMKKNNRISNGIFRVCDRVYESQKRLLASVLNVNTSQRTVEVLNKYQFLDDTLKSVVRRMYFAVTGTNDTYLYLGKEIHHDMKILHK
jgi:hypothetical protein